MRRSHQLRTVDATAGSLVMYAVPLMVLQLTGSTSWTGIAFTLAWAPRMLDILGAGPLVARRTARTIATATNLLRATLAVAATIGLTAGHPLPTILTFGLLAGMLAEGSFVAVEDLGARASRRAGAHGYRIQATQTLIDQATLIVGPLAGGLLLLAGPFALLTAVAALSLLGGALARSLSSEGHTEATVRGVATQLRSGTRALRRTPGLIVLVVTMAALDMTSGALQLTAPILVTDTFQQSEASVSIIWAIATAACLLASRLCRRVIDRSGLAKVGIVAISMAVLAVFMASQAHSFTAYVAALAVFFAGETVLTTVLRTVRTTLMPADTFAPTLAVSILFIVVPLPAIGALVAVTPSHRLPLVTLGCALTLVVAGACCIARLRQVRMKTLAKAA